MDKFELQTAMDEIWRLIGDLDQFIAENEPYKVVKENPETAHKDVRYCAEELARIAVSLLPFMPETADSILELVREKKTPHEPLFVRKK
jgi:methionyl-tRNA synthetase